MQAGKIEGIMTLDGQQYFDTLKQAEQRTNQFNQNLNKAGQSMQSAGKTLMTRVSAPLLGVAAISTKLGMDFESAMSQVQALSGETGAGMEILEKKARDMGATTKFSASDAANAMGYMGMAGWGAQQMLGGLDGVMMLAAASGEDLAMVSDIVTDSLTGFGLKAEDAGHFADVLATASSKSNTNVAMMGETFKYVAPLAGAMGYSIEDMALATGLMANAGIKGGQAGTVLRGAITRLIKPSKESAGMIKELGIKMEDSNGKMLPFRDVLGQLREKFDTLDESQQGQYAATIFGQEAMSGMLSIINASDDDFAKLTKSIDNSTGAAKEMSDIMNDNLKGAWQEFKSLLEETALQLYEQLLPHLKDGLEMLKGWLQAFSDLDPATKEMIIKIGGFAAVLGPTLFVGGKFLTLIGGIGSGVKIAATGLGLLSPAIGGVGTAAGLASGTAGVGGLATGLGGMAAAAAPYALALAGATALGYGLYKGLNSDVIPEIDLFGDHVAYTSETIQTEFGAIDGAVQKTTTVISEETEQQLTDFFTMTDGVSKMVNDMYVGLEENTSEGMQFIVETVGTATDALMQASDDHTQKVIGNYQDMFDKTTVLSDEEQMEIMKTVKDGQADREEKTKEHKEAILKIMDEVRRQGGEITKSQVDEVNRLMDEMKIQSVETMSQNEAEQNVILNRLASSSDRITVEMVSDTIKEFNRQYDETTKLASDERDEIVRQAEQLKIDSGGEHSDLADKIIDDANRQYKDVVEAADKTRTEGFNKLSNAHGELANKVDKDTGNILTWWGSLKAWWDGWKPENKSISVTTTENRVVNNPTYGERPGYTGNDNANSMRKNYRGTNFFEGGLTWVGEQGRELIELPRGSKIHSNTQSESIAGGQGKGITQNITINSPQALSPSETARKNLQASRQLASEWGV